MQNTLVDTEVQTDKRLKTIQDEPQGKQDVIEEPQQPREITPTHSAKSSVKSKESSIRLPNIQPTSTHNYTKLSPEEEKIRSDTIRKLNAENKRLIEEIKKLNDKLTEIITKQANKPIRRKENTAVARHEMGLQKELQEAYKQIDGYKKTIDKQKFKELPIEQVSRINDLENKIKSHDMELKTMKKQVKTIDGIKSTQEKEISRTQNQGPKTKINRLTYEILENKEKLKNIRKEMTKEADHDRDHHEYTVTLERLAKQLGQDKQKKKEDVAPEYQPTEEEWKNLNEEVEKARKTNTDLIKKIDNLKKTKQKSSQQWQEMDLMLKQRSKKLEVLVKKSSEAKTLSMLKRPNRPSIDTANQDLCRKWESPKPTLKEFTIGKMLSGAVSFSDGKMLPDIQQVRIKKLTIWTNEHNEICGLFAKYLINDTSLVSGNLVGNCDNSNRKEIEVGSTTISRITGTLNKKGYIVSLRVLAKSGDVWNTGKEGDTAFELAEDKHYISELFGASVDSNSGPVLCMLGCRFRPLQDLQTSG